MVARHAQARFPGDRLLGPIVRRLKGSSGLVAGKASLPSERKDTKGLIAFLRSKLKKHSWVSLTALNVLVAIGIGMTVDALQKPPVDPPVGTSATPTPSSSLATLGPPATSDPAIPLSQYDLSPQIQTSHWYSWALLDQSTGTVVGSENFNKPSYLGAVMKPWIAADYLNRHPNPSNFVLDELSTMIMDNNDEMAYKYFGEGSSLKRFVKACGITDIVYRNWSWSLTEISARDMVRYGACIYNGDATSDKWTDWIVDKMRNVRGDGDFGSRRLFQDRTQIATSNGWFFWEGKWYVNCLAVTSEWAISVVQQWPYSGGDLQYGIALANPNCKSITDQVLKLNVQ